MVVFKRKRCINNQDPGIAASSLRDGSHPSFEFISGFSGDRCFDTGRSSNTAQELVWCVIVVTAFAARLYLPTFKTLDSRLTTSHHDTMIAFNIVVVFMDFPSVNGTYLPYHVYPCLPYMSAIYVSSLSLPTPLISAMPECPEVFLVFVESFGWGSSVRSGALDLCVPSQN